MSPELTGFVLGLLLGAAKVMTIAAVGFGVAWWRARLRIGTLEAELLESRERLPRDDEVLRQFGDRLVLITRQLQDLTATQALLAERLLPPPPNPGTDAPARRTPGPQSS